jgi:hypothetical protein
LSIHSYMHRLSIVNKSIITLHSHTVHTVYS